MNLGETVGSSFYPTRRTVEERFDKSYLFLVILVFRACLPWFQYRSKAIIVVPFFVLWYMFQIAKPYKIDIRRLMTLRSSFWLFVIIMILYRILPLVYGGWSSDGRDWRIMFTKGALTNLTMNVAFVFIVYFSILREKYKELRFLGIVVLLSVLYVGIMSWCHGDEVAGGASRFVLTAATNQLKEGGRIGEAAESALVVGKYGLGGYEIVYMTAFAIPGILFSALKIKSHRMRVLCIVAGAAGVGTVLKGGLQTPVMVMLVGLLFFFLGIMFKLRRALIYLGVICMLLIGIFVVRPESFAFLAPALRAASELTEQDFYKGRLVSLAEAVEGDKLTYSYSRYRLQAKSWEGFCEHPIFGGGTKARMGEHSELLDTMSIYGLVGLSLMIAVLVSYFKFNCALAMGMRERQWLPLVYGYTGLYIFTSITNPVNILSPLIILLFPALALSYPGAPLDGSVCKEGEKPCLR